MAIHTALSFAMVGIALRVMDVETSRGVRLAQVLALLGAFVPFLILVTYVYDIQFPGAVNYTTSMALHTAITFLLLCAGILLARPRQGLIREILSERVGGVVARWMLPTTMVALFVLGWLRLEGQAIGLYGTEVGLSVMVVSNIAVLSFVVWRMARALNRADEKRVELNRVLLQRAEELAAVNKELEAFSYSVSHDLRAPLRTLDGFSQMLLEDYVEKLDEEGRRRLERIRAASQRLGRLIDDLLSLSRLSRTEVKSETVDLSGLAAAIAAELHQSDPYRRVEFVIADGHHVQGDVGLLRAALTNLLNNAWKFTSKHPMARIEFGAMHLNGQTVYFVKDDGAGFDPSYTNKLFAPFQRLHGTREFDGSGIGLATVQRIVRRHGGDIRAEAAVEKGATFYFTLGK
ncbi:MAG: hypothetical protein HY706_08185 [Candidatus Hydrogenedentes bacterium]|nr:hypothetical protein [Candidatus Hydrogenedentota bacterium]